jgi:hypothetical protein
LVAFFPGIGDLVGISHLCDLPSGRNALRPHAGKLAENSRFRASRRHGYGPFWLGFLAAAVILIGKFFFDAEQATYAGIGLLVAASIWNSWPRSAAAVPYCCVPAGESSYSKRT